ncbi:hypothetical protein [Aquisphaera insulae]|uniref:hypothetical protein n=1 Tax=Aquisphaera insulae TaxID=2712864 RepID=UPI0013E9A90F|nr:hypothetical protein [Aquisphaera insulae]
MSADSIEPSMGGESPVPEPADRRDPIPARGDLDVVGLLMAVATVALVVAAAWMRFGPTPADRIEVGAPLPPLRLLDLQTEESKLLLGQRDRVLWVVFWSAGSASGPKLLGELERAWRRLRAHRGFTLAAAAVEADRPDLVRQVAAASRASLPIYLAGPETRRRFSAGGADPPIHMLVDSDGRIAMLSKGSDRDTIEHMAAMVEGWLRGLDPLGNTRFADSSRGASRGASSTGCGGPGREIRPL